MAPAAVEMIAGLGRLDALVAVGDWVHWPPAAAALPRIGAHDAPNLERILELGITHYITVTGRSGAPAHQRLREFGVEVVTLDTATLSGTWDALRSLGRVLGAEASAAGLIAALQAELDTIAARTRESVRPRTLVVVGTEPLYVAGPGSHLDELVRIAGGENIFADCTAPYALVSREAVLERRPAVIVDISDNRPGALRGQTRAGWEAWEFVPAVTAGRIFRVDPDRLTIPGPRLAQMARLMARLIHPEIFGQPAPEDYGSLR